MAALSYMQRRISGTHEFRKRLPERLAGKEAPAHMREAFGDLINAKMGCFKRELVRSLQSSAAQPEQNFLRDSAALPGAAVRS
jgi:hypothetical protein